MARVRLRPRTKRSTAWGTWAAPPFLALCLGFVAWIWSGDPGLAATIAAVSLVAGLVYAIASRRARDSGLLYVIGAVLAGLTFLNTYCGTRRGRTAWHAAQRAFATKAPRPATAERRPELYIRHFVTPTYPRLSVFRRFFTAFDEDGVYLAPAFPHTLVYDPLRIPRQAVRSCGIDPECVPPCTVVTVKEPPVEVGVPDVGGRVRDWCLRLGIPTQAR